MTIYTKKGDRGETTLFNKKNLNKSDRIFDALGVLDKTNSLIGVTITFLDEEKDQSLIDQLQTIQASLLGIGSCLASDQPSQALVVPTLSKLTNELELQIDLWEKKLPQLKNFIIPGGDPSAAHLQLTRSVIREFERTLHSLDSIYKFDELTTYINRLSDYFFQAARYLNFIKNKSEIIWTEN